MEELKVDLQNPAQGMILAHGDGFKVKDPQWKRIAGEFPAKPLAISPRTGDNDTRQTRKSRYRLEPWNN